MRMIGRFFTAVFVLSTLLAIFLTASCSKEVNPTIALFTPRDQNDVFWGLVESYMRAAGQDLGLELKVYYAQGDANTMARQIEEAAADPTIDGLVFQSFENKGETFIQTANEAAKPCFLINSGVDYAVVGTPGEKYPYWIGEMLPDDETAGYDLARLLVEKAREENLTDSEGIAHIIAIEGQTEDGASIERVKGFNRAMEELDDVILHRLVSAGWKRDVAKHVYLDLIKEFPQTTVIWTASDHMALGVLDGAREMSLLPNKEFVVGGVDWSDDGLWSVAAGELTISMGGHFVEGGWAAIMLYDHLNGIAISKAESQKRTRMYAVTAENIRPYFTRIYKRNWDEIDFTKFSKKYNRELQSYNFNLESSFKK